jgi:DNA-binding response OmpR family regulator
MIRLLRRKARLLLLDDDPAMQRLIATVLRRNGYHVEVVSSGSQAIEKMARVKYDALLLDLMTPTEGGMTVVRHLKQTAPAMLQRVVLVTGSPEAVLKTVAPDVAAVVQKPFDTAELIATVQRVTSQQ